MNALSLVVIFFILVAILVLYTFQNLAKNKAQLSKLRSDRQRLEKEVTESKDALRTLRRTEQSLSATLSTLRAGGEPMHIDDSLLQKEEPAERMISSSVVDELLQRKMTTPENVAKAEKYKKESKSPLPIEDILIMLNYARKDAVELLKKKIAKSKAASGS
jgi:septal ring factor EnvC (AmiA/AmiB activator)